MVKFSVRHPVSITMLIGVLVVLGFVSLSKMGLDLMPDVSFPSVTVVTKYEGAAPEEVENMVTKPIEEAVSRINGVKRVYSVSYEGVSVVTVEFEWGKDLDFAAQDVRDRLGYIEKYLPRDADKPLVLKFEMSMMPVLEVAVSSDKRSPEEVKKILDKRVKPFLEKIDGVAQVQLFGGRDREVWVEIDPQKLIYYGLSLDDISRALMMSNINMPAGRLEHGEKEYTIRLIGQFKDIKELDNAIVGFTKYGVPIRLKDIGKAIYTYSERRGFSTLDHQEIVAIEVMKQSGMNTVKVTEKVKKQLNSLQKSLPPDLKFTITTDQSKIIRRVTSRTTSNAYMGALLAALMILLFLRNLRPTLVIAIAIPLSVIIAFIVLYFAGYTLNMMVLGGMALGVGMLVDNAVVVLENITRHLEEEGEDRKTASINATNEVGLAISSSTFTNIVVFLPLIYVGGMVGKLTMPMAVTVAVTLLASLFVAITIIPMLASVFLKERKEEEYKKAFGETWFLPIREAYARVLKKVIAHKWKVFIGAAILFILSLALVPFIGLRFMPDIDQDFGMMKVTLPTGTRLRETANYAWQIEDILLKQPEVQHAGATVGEGPEEFSAFMGTSGTNEAMIYAVFKESKERKRKSYQVIKDVMAELPQFKGANVERVDFFSMAYTGGKSPIDVKIYGNDLNTLKGLATVISDKVAKVKGAYNIHLSLEETKPQIQIHIDKDLAAHYGLIPAMIESQVQAAVKGQFATWIKHKGEDIDIIVRFPKSDVDDINEIKRLPIKTPMGTFITLNQVARVEFAKGPVKIEREKQSRMIEILGDVKGRSIGQVMRDVEKELSQMMLPTGYTIEYGGEFEQIKDMLKSMGFALLAAIVLVYMVMAALFESFRDPLIVMFTVPFALIGVILMLFLTRVPISVSSLVGVLILSGIVVNNAIVMIDYIKTLRDRGVDAFDAVIRGASRRLRPILITAITTIFGMLPMAISHSEGAEMRAPMAIAVIGGLFFSTLLTLFVIPAVYSIFEGIKPPEK